MSDLTDEDRARAYPCPTCMALPGYRCLKPDGKPYRHKFAHKKRLALLDAARADLEGTDGSEETILSAGNRRSRSEAIEKDRS